MSEEYTRELLNFFDLPQDQLTKLVSKVEKICILLKQKLSEYIQGPDRIIEGLDIRFDQNFSFNLSHRYSIVIDVKRENTELTFTLNLIDDILSIYYKEFILPVIGLYKNFEDATFFKRELDNIINIFTEKIKLNTYSNFENILHYSYNINKCILLNLIPVKFTFYYYYYFDYQDNLLNDYVITLDIKKEENITKFYFYVHDTNKNFYSKLSYNYSDDSDDSEFYKYFDLCLRLVLRKINNFTNDKLSIQDFENKFTNAKLFIQDFAKKFSEDLKFTNDKLSIQDFEKKFINAKLYIQDFEKKFNEELKLSIQDFEKKISEELNFNWDIAFKSSNVEKTNFRNINKVFTFEKNLYNYYNFNSGYDTIYNESLTSYYESLFRYGRMSRYYQKKQDLPENFQETLSYTLSDTFKQKLKNIDFDKKYIEGTWLKENYSFEITKDTYLYKGVDECNDNNISNNITDSKYIIFTTKKTGFYYAETKIYCVKIKKNLKLLVISSKNCLDNFISNVCNLNYKEYEKKFDNILNEKLSSKEKVNKLNECINQYINTDEKEDKKIKLYYYLKIITGYGDKKLLNLITDDILKEEILQITNEFGTTKFSMNDANALYRFKDVKYQRSLINLITTVSDYDGWYSERMYIKKFNKPFTVEKYILEDYILEEVYIKNNSDNYEIIKYVNV
jgi:hypothetical protein